MIDLKILPKVLCTNQKCLRPFNISLNEIADKLYKIKVSCQWCKNEREFSILIGEGDVITFLKSINAVNSVGSFTNMKKIGVRVIKKKSRIFVACIFKEDFINKDIYYDNIKEWESNSSLELLNLYIKE